MTRSVVALLTELLDAVEETAAYVSGVVALASGHLDGGSTSWLGRRLTGRPRVPFGHADVARGLASAYGPDQLRKAAAEAVRLGSLTDELRATGECPELDRRLDELHVREMARELAEARPRSDELRLLHQRLVGAAGAVVQTRAVLSLRRGGNGSGVTAGP